MSPSMGINIYVYIFVMLLTVSVLGYFGYLYYQKKFKKAKKVVRRPAQQARIGGANADADVAAGGAMRRRVAAAAAQRQNRLQARMQQVEHSDSEHDSGDDEGDKTKKGGAKIGVKKQRKIEEKKERKEQREREEREREIKKKEEAEKEKEEKLKREEEERLEKERLEAERLAKEEAERKEEELYQQMKAEFEIEDEGLEAAIDEETAKKAFQDFINHIKEVKIVMVEELAEKFHLKTQECIDRLKSLQESGELSGVMDDRGKFIYITRAEYEAVAKFIKQRGRVTIKELAENSNRLIKLNQTV